MKIVFIRPIFPTLSLAILVFIVACTHKVPRVNHLGVRQYDYVYRMPEQIEDGWEVSSLIQEGIDASLISECMRRILVESYKNIHSVLIVKNGKLILEEYFYDYHRNKKHQIRSATKSIGSILTGIAIDQGFIRNAEETIYPYFNTYSPDIQWDNRSKAVTIKSLLTMTSGYNCDDHGTNFACENNMYKTKDWVAYALNLPMAHPPGNHWAYNSTSLILVGEIISKQSKMSIPEFAEKYLFKSLGITDFKWGLSPKGRAWLAGNAKMRPRDMAKFGYMVLNNGKWKSRRVVSQAWLDESTAIHFSHLPGRFHQKYGIKYGYLWWHRTYRRKNPINGNMESVKAIYASGNGGQQIFIFPTLDMVVVFTGGNYNSRLADQPNAMLINYILPAVL